MPLCSIIIPAFNRADHLPVAIESIRAQTFQDWECLIVDDNSDDGTSKVVEQISRKDPRIKYILNQRTKGAQGARNTGILNSSCDWIAFNDSDDEWLADKLEKQIAILQNYKFDYSLVVHGDCFVNDHSMRCIKEWKLTVVEGIRPFTKLLNEPSPVFPSLLTSKKALKEVGLLDENVPSYQEWDTALKLSKICRFVHLKEPLFIYHKHSGSTISKDMRRDVSGVHYIRLKYKADYLRYYGKSSYSDKILANIRRLAPLRHWNYGAKLLQQARNDISGADYFFLLACFRLQIDPNILLNKVSNIKKIVKIGRTNQS